MLFYDWNELFLFVKCREENMENGKRFEIREIFCDEENISYIEVRDIFVYLICSFFIEEDVMI